MCKLGLGLGLGYLAPYYHRLNTRFDLTNDFQKLKAVEASKKEVPAKNERPRPKIPLNNPWLKK